MTPYQDYPRMMFHRSGLTCVVLSRDEEDGLGADWRRVVWPVEVPPPVETATGLLASAGPEPEEDGDPWDAPANPLVGEQPHDESSAFEPAPKKPAARKRR
jgi:hypothetical protein